MGRKCRKTTSLASMCVVCAAGWLRVTWPPGRNCWKRFPGFDFSFFSYSINIQSVETQFSKMGLCLICWVFFPTTTNITLFFHQLCSLASGIAESVLGSCGELIGQQCGKVLSSDQMLCLCPPPALRSRSGRSIINGNWAIDRPGRYEGGGTMFTYRRPNEISSTAGESFLADGPTNEVLDVYVS